MFLDVLPWLHAAAVGDAAMLADRKVKFVPDMDGFALPNALHWLLLPLSKRKVRSAPCDSNIRVHASIVIQHNWPTSACSFVHHITAAASS